jgi:hypothetical protein
MVSITSNDIKSKLQTEGAYNAIVLSDPIASSFL